MLQYKVYVRASKSGVRGKMDLEKSKQFVAYFEDWNTAQLYLRNLYKVNTGHDLNNISAGTYSDDQGNIYFMLYRPNGWTEDTYDHWDEI